MAVLEEGKWFSGGSTFWVSDGFREVYHDMTDAQKRKVNPDAKIIAQIDTSKRFVCFREDELADVFLIG